MKRPLFNHTLISGNRHQSARLSSTTILLKGQKKKKRPGFSVNNDLLIANSLFILVLDVQRERIKGHVNEKKRGLFRAVEKPSRLLPAFINPAALWKSGAQKRSSGKVLACHLKDKKLSTCQLFGLTINLAILPSQPTFLLRRLQFGEGKKKTPFQNSPFVSAHVLFSLPDIERGLNTNLYHTTVGVSRNKTRA